MEAEREAMRARIAEFEASVLTSHVSCAVICSHMQSYAVICSHMQSYAVTVVCMVVALDNLSQFFTVCATAYLLTSVVRAVVVIALPDVDAE